MIKDWLIVLFFIPVNQMGYVSLIDLTFKINPLFSDPTWSQAVWCRLLPFFLNDQLYIKLDLVGDLLTCSDLELLCLKYSCVKSNSHNKSVFNVSKRMVVLIIKNKFV